MQKVNLNLIPGGVRPVVNVSQYDEGRQFQLAIFNGSASYDLTGKTVTIEVGKNDGNGCAYGVTDLVNTVPVVAVSGNIVTITTPIQMTACAGENIGELKIAESGNEIGTLNFVLLCEQSALSPDTPISDTEIPEIIDAAREASSHYPYIDPTTKNWIAWDVTTGAWVDTGVRAEGIDGQGSVQTVNNVLPDANGNVSLSLTTDAAGILPTANGGTGNADGYIRTGLNATYPYSGQYSTQEGQYTYGAGSCSHAEGQTTEARGDYSHSEGRYTKAIGNCSHASGIGTKAEQNYQFVIGRYNKNKTDTAFEIGNGTNALPSPTHNLMEVYKDGRIVMDEADALVSGGNLAAVVELTRTMTAQRAAGSYVFVVADKKTYYIDTTILATGELTPGTNATEVTVFGQISSLNSDFAAKHGSLDWAHAVSIPLTGNFIPTSDGMAYMYGASISVGRTYIYIFDNQLGRILAIYEVNAVDVNIPVAFTCEMTKNRSYACEGSNITNNASIFVPYT